MPPINAASGGHKPAQFKALGAKENIMKTNCDNCNHEITIEGEHVSGTLHHSGYETFILCEHCVGYDPSGEEETGIIVGVRV